MSDPHQHLNKLLNKLTQNENYVALVQDFSSELHDIFETLLTEALMTGNADDIDGAKVLAMCMELFRGIRDTQPTQTRAPKLGGLPSQRRHVPTS